MSQLVPFLNFGLEDSQLVESDYFDSYENLAFDSGKMFIALEGLNSGVPTRTTPTLTPTTLRNIEQTFIELQSKPESHENEAGFVPPLVHSIGNNQYISASDVDIYSTKSNGLWHSTVSQSSSDSSMARPTPPVTPNHHHNHGFQGTLQPSTATTTTTRRNMGGRKPAKDVNISPEEEERRRIRRLRNKAAAARCRQRRVDHTKALIEETERLEQKKQSLQDELQKFQQMKEELEYILEAHQLHSHCNLENRSVSPPDIKPYALPPFDQQQQQQDERVKTELLDQQHNHHHHQQHHLDSSDIFNPPPAKRIMLSSTVPISKPSRPNSLNVAATAPKGGEVIAGVAITTPSAGMQFNFESLMGGGTGLTPVSQPVVYCGTQQRNVPVSCGEVGTPESGGPPKLVSL